MRNDCSQCEHRKRRAKAVQIWISPETRRRLKTIAANVNMCVRDYVDLMVWLRCQQSRAEEELLKEIEETAKRSDMDMEEWVKQWVEEHSSKALIRR